MTEKIQNENAPGRFVNLHDGRLHVVERGLLSGPVVVLIPGFNTPHFVFDQNAKALEDAGCRVIMFDHFGRGWSDRPDGPYDADFFDQELLGLLDSLQLVEPVHLVGYSMGGLIAAEFSARHAARVQTLFLIATAGFELNMFNNVAFTQVLQVPLIGDWTWRLFGRWHLTDSSQYDPDAIQSGCCFKGDTSTQMEFKGFLPALLATWRNLPMQNRDETFGRATMAGVSMAAVFGGVDTIVGIASARRLLTVASHARVTTIADGDHGLLYRKYDRINPILLDFILSEGTDPAETRP